MARNTFDEWRRDEPLPFVQGKVTGQGFDYWRRGEPLEDASGLEPVTGTGSFTQTADWSASASSAAVTVDAPMNRSGTTLRPAEPYTIRPRAVRGVGSFSEPPGQWAAVGHVSDDDLVLLLTA